MPAFISDGYTQDGFVKASPGIHEDVRFTYRPSTTVERKRLFSDDFLKLAGDKQAEKTATDLAGRILSWDIKDGDKDVPITAANLQRLTFAVFERLTDIVHGAAAGDDAKN